MSPRAFKKKSETFPIVADDSVNEVQLTDSGAAECSAHGKDFGVHSHNARARSTYTQ